MQTEPATDAELIAAIRQGDRAAFAALVDRCANMVTAIAYAATRDRELAEDLAQDTFLAAWRDLDRLRDPAAVKPWLCGIARNLASKARRRRGREDVTADLDAYPGERTPYDATREAELEKVVATALATVPAMYREVLVLFYYEQRSTKDVAAALAISEEAVHKRLSRGRQFLAAGIAEIVADDLERRRSSQRELAARVLAALPLGLPAGHPVLVTKGSTMLKLGMFAAAVTAVTLGTLAARASGSPSAASAATTQTKRTATIASPPTAARRRSNAPTPGVARTCAGVAEHLVVIALAGFDTTPDAHAARARREMDQLERQCGEERWSPTQLACLAAVGATRDIRTCIPVSKPTPIAPLVTGALTCDNVGKHVHDLMVASMSGVAQDNIAGSVLHDIDERPEEVVDVCVDQRWSEDRLHCYAAATRFTDVVACNLDD